LKATARQDAKSHYTICAQDSSDARAQDARKVKLNVLLVQVIDSIDIYREFSSARELCLKLVLRKVAIRLRLRYIGIGICGEISFGSGIGSGKGISNRIGIDTCGILSWLGIERKS